MTYRDFLSADQRFRVANEQNDGAGRGWDFTPEPERNPSSFFIGVIAVGLVLICMAACLASEVTA